MNTPTLVSWTRLPLAAAFPFVHHHVGLSLVLLALAGASDVLDGFLARRLGLATPTGAVVDGVADKMFVAAVLSTLVATGKMSLAEVVLLGARELGELPLLLLLIVSPALRRRKIEDGANLLGKAGTVLQFATVVAILLQSPARTPLLILTCAVGLAAAASYFRRTLAATR